MSRAAIHAALKRDGYCIVGMLTQGKYGACSAGLDPHHIDTVGSGGDDDIKNIITLCRAHHDMAQARKIPASELRELLSGYYGYEY